MRLKVIFGHPKWPPAAILLKKIKVAYWSEMARNVIKSDFRSSKMADGSHFVKKKSCVLIWNGEKCDQKWFSVIHFVPKNQSCVLIWNSEKCDRKWFSIIQNGRQQPFCENNKSCVLIWKWREMRSKVIFGHPKWGGGGASQWPACKPFGDIHSICPWANTPILVFLLFWHGAYLGWHKSHQTRQSEMANTSPATCHCLATFTPLKSGLRDLGITFSVACDVREKNESFWIDYFSVFYHEYGYTNHIFRKNGGWRLVLRSLKKFFNRVYGIFL